MGHTEAIAMGQWSVDRDGSTFAITAEPGSGVVTFEVTQPFHADVTTAQEIRLLMGAAIGTAQGEQQP